MVTLSLTTRDREILSTISGPCRFLTVSQVARTFWPSSKAPISDARKRLFALKSAGLIDTGIIMAHPELDLKNPVFSWPGGKIDSLGQVAHRVKRRWTRPLEATRIVVATPEGRNLIGAGPGRPIRRSETTHDLHLAGVYLAYRQQAPDLAARWVSGDHLEAENFEKIPDAIIRDDQGGIARIIDFAGSYGAGKLKAMHAEYEGFSYELW